MSSTNGMSPSIPTIIHKTLGLTERQQVVGYYRWARRCRKAACLLTELRN